MAGVFPSSGVAANAAVNGVNVDTTCATELFYSLNACSQRMDSSAMNAVISEIVNVVSCAGSTYDCSSLTNLCEAIRKIGTITIATDGVSIGVGSTVRSSDGVLYYNCTTAAITPAAAANVTATGLALLGLCAVVADIVHVSLAAAGTPIPVGAIVQSSDGSVYHNCTAAPIIPAAAADITDAGLVALGLCAVSAVPSTAAAAGVDSFANNFNIGDQLITFANGETLAIPPSVCSAAALTDVEIDALTGDERLSICVGGVPRSVQMDQVLGVWFSDGVAPDVAVAGTVVPPGGCVTSTSIPAVIHCNETVEPIGLTGTTDAALVADGLTAATTAAGGAVTVVTAAAAGVDSFGRAFVIGDEVMTLADGVTTSMLPGPSTAATAVAAGVDSFGNNFAIGDEVITLPNAVDVAIPAASQPLNAYTASLAGGNPSDWFMAIANAPALQVMPAGPTADGYWEVYESTGRTAANTSLAANHNGTDSVPVFFRPADVLQVTDAGTTAAGSRRLRLIWRSIT